MTERSGGRGRGSGRDSSRENGVGRSRALEPRIGDRAIGRGLLEGGLVVLVVASVLLAAVPGSAVGTAAPDGSGSPAQALTSAGPLPGGTVTDATENASFVGDYCVQVGDVRYGESGTVSAVGVDLAGGADGNVSASTVDTVRVVLRNASEGILAVARAPYDAHGTTVTFDGTVAGVDRVTLAAKAAEEVPDGATIDAAVTLSNGTDETGYDTGRIQVARTAERGFVVGSVLNDRGLPVENATVEVIDVGTGATVTTLTTDGDGRFGPQQVVPNRSYTVEARKPGYVGKTFSKRVFVAPGETESIPVTLEVRVAADTLRLVTADLGDPNTTDDDRLTDEEPVLVADGSSSNDIQLVAIVENRSAEAGDGPGAGFFDVTVTLEFANDTGVGDFLDNDRIDRRINVTTTLRSDVDGDGYVEAYAPFSITADAANDSSMYATAVMDTPRGSFVNALGQAVVAVGIEGASDPRFENGSSNESESPDPGDGASDPGTPVVSGLEDLGDVSPGETVAVSATVTGRNGTALDERTLELRIDADGDGSLTPGETVATETVSVAEGGSAAVGFTVDVPEVTGGEYRYGVVTAPPSENASATLTVRVEAWRAYDDDGDGEISTGELRTAIADWAAGAIGTGELNDVVAKWAGGE